MDAGRKWGFEVAWWRVGISAHGVGGGVAGESYWGGGGEFRECQLRAERGCGGASRRALCEDNTV